MARPGRHVRRETTPRRVLAVAGVALVVVAAGVTLRSLGHGGSDRVGPTSPPSTGSGHSSRPATPSTPTPTSDTPVTPTPDATATPTPVGPFEVATTRVPLVDRDRTFSADGEARPRTLPTTVWYPSDSSGPFPLVVFAHGFDLFPSTYAPLLHAWARAGFVVAAPVFPRTNPDAVGGLDEADIVNQPADVRFVITQLVRRSRSGTGRLAGLIDPGAIGVAGHSDGGETAMAIAYDSCCRDRRIDATIVMAGAQMPIAGGRYLRAYGPPLLAIQGTADTVNSPAHTSVLYAGAPTPKYLLWLHGADHLGPFTDAVPYEAIVRRLTIAFLDRYLGRASGAPIRLPAGARSTGVATLRADT